MNGVLEAKTTKRTRDVWANWPTSPARNIILTLASRRDSSEEHTGLPTTSLPTLTKFHACGGDSSITCIVTLTDESRAEHYSDFRLA